MGWVFGRGIICLGWVGLGWGLGMGYTPGVGMGCVYAAASVFPLSIVMGGVVRCWAEW